MKIKFRKVGEYTEITVGASIEENLGFYSEEGLHAFSVDIINQIMNQLDTLQIYKVLDELGLTYKD